MGTPLGGLHGEHVVIRADIEDEIGWDFPEQGDRGCLFRHPSSRLGYPKRSTTLNSYSYGASPAYVRDLIRQRRRWVEGLIRLALNRQLPLVPKLPLVYSIFTWVLAPFQFVGLALLISYVSGLDNTSPISPVVLRLGPSPGRCLLVIPRGSQGQPVCIGSPRPHLLLSFVFIPAIYVITLIETIGVPLGIVRFLGLGSQKVSEVITKPL